MATSLQQLQQLQALLNQQAPTLNRGFGPGQREELLTQGLLGLGGGLLQAGAPSVGRPGPGFGPAILQLQQSLQQGKRDITARAAAKSQLESAIFNAQTGRANAKLGLINAAENIKQADKDRDAKLKIAKIRAGKLSARDRKIKSLVEQDVSPQRAANIVDGIERIEINDLGQPVLINDIDQSVQEIPAKQAKVIAEAQAKVPPAPKTPAAAKIPVKRAFGAGQVLKRLSDKSLGQVFDTFSFPNERVANNIAAGLKQDIISALAVSNRPPIIEQERILASLPDTGFFENPDSAKEILNTVIDRLAVQQADDKRFGDDARNPPKLRREAKERVRAINRTVKLMERFDGVSRGKAKKEAPPTAIREGTVIHNQSTGERMIRRNGKWEPL